MQAGCEVVGLADAAKSIGGYGVHAAKVARCGVPFYLSHTIVEVIGNDKVEKATIAEVDEKFNFIPGTEKTFEIDTVCVAVGLSPMSNILSMAGCTMKNTPGGYVPCCDKTGRTSIPGIYAAGDVAGIEEASSAMIEGRMSGCAIAQYLGYMKEEAMQKRISELDGALESLHKGMFAPQNRGKHIERTDEGIMLSESLLKKGYVDDSEIFRYPGVIHKVGVHPVMECTQNIPCNPCQDACPKGCISIGKDITSLPAVNEEEMCIGCGMCVAACSGQAIFLVNEDVGEGYATVTLPYEFLPLPKEGDKGKALGRDGRTLCDAVVVGIKTSKAYDCTSLLTIQVPGDMAMKARFFKVA